MDASRNAHGGAGTDRVAWLGVDGRVWLALAAVALLLPFLGSAGLSAPDEPRAAAVAREMFTFEHGPSGLVLLHLNREPYTQKPPLYYWLVSLVSLGPGEVNEWSARLPSAVAGLVTVALTFLFGRRLLGLRTALLGAALLLTTYKFAHLARRAQFDVVLAAFEVTALLCYWRLFRGVGDAARSRLGMHAAMGLAMLTKGPVGLLIPLLVATAHLGVEGRLRDARRLFSPLALLLSLGPILAWLAAAVALAPAGFFGETVGGGVVSRFFEGTSHARPFYYYAYQFPLEFMPWALLWPTVFWAARRRVFVDGGGDDDDRRRAWRFLLTWVAVNLVFFSLSAGKRGLYLLPCFPAVALLTGDALRALLAGRARPPRALAIGAAVAGLAFVGLAAHVARLDEVAGAEIPPLFLALLAGIPIAGAVAWRACVRRGSAGAVAAVLVACAWGILVAASWVLNPALDPVRSVEPVANAALRWIGPDDPVALLGSEPKIGGLSYYARRPVHWLDEVDEVPDYFAGGGRALVMDADKLPRVRERVDVVVLERLREGDRAMIVVGPPHVRREATKPDAATDPDGATDARRGVSQGETSRPTPP